MLGPAAYGLCEKCPKVPITVIHYLCSVEWDVDINLVMKCPIISTQPFLIWIRIDLRSENVK